MSKISRLKRLEERILRKQIAKQREADQKLHEEMIASYCLNSNHPRPTTRREFLDSGVTAMSTAILGPSIYSIISVLSPEARAQVAMDCPAPAAVATGPVPFINLHLSGGIQSLSIAPPRTTAGARLASYTRLGLGVTPTTVNNIFANGTELFDGGTAGQGFLRGLQNGAAATTLAKAAMVTIPIGDNGDSSQAFSILGLVNRAGRAGAKLGFLRNGGDNAATGIDGSSAFNINTSVSPTSINSTQAILNSVNLTGALARLTGPQQLRLGRAIQSLNSEQAARITGLNGGQEMAKLVKCATEQNIKNLEGGGAALDPRQVAGLGAIWGNFANTGGGGNGGTFNNDAIAAIVLNVLNGNAAGAGIGIGNFDIHASINSRVGQEIGVFNIGQAIGRMLESAQLLNSKLFIHITTNGAVVNPGGTVNDRYDDDDNNGNCFGASHFIMFDPAGPVTTTSDLPQQIGGLTATGNVDKSVFTAVVNDGEAAAFYNYCVFSTGNENLFNQAMAGVKTYSAAQKQIMRKKA